MPDLETEEEAAERIAKTSDNDKVFNMLSELDNNMDFKINNLDKMFTDKKINTEKKLDDANNEYNELLLE